jgi:alanine racemase
MTALDAPTGEAGSSLLCGLRATRAFIDLDAIAGNLRTIRESLPPRTRIMAVVKADAYGHGAPWVANAALKSGASLLGVATVGEGRALREAGIDSQIVLLGAIDPGEAAGAVRGRLDVTVAEPALLQAVQDAARDVAPVEPARVHLKIDTGLRRYGAPPELSLALAARIAADRNLSFAGVCTHFASADEPEEPFTAEQLRRFDAAVEQLKRDRLRVPERHVANSAGILRGIGCDVEMVRLGIALYGVPPSDGVAILPGMRPAMRIESKIARVFALAPGESVGYNRTFRADRPMRGALIPIGYADGYRRSFSNSCWVGIKGRRARVLGRVSMDQIVVELPADIEAEVGEPVHVLGGGGDSDGPSVHELARQAGTNSYEILVGIRSRIPRVFVKSGEVVGVRGEAPR